MNILKIFKERIYNPFLSFKTDFLESKLSQLVDFCSEKTQNIYLFYKNKIIDPSNFKKILKNIYILYQYNHVTPWPSSLSNAKLVVNNACRFSNIYSMLNEIIFSEELCLHKIIQPDLEDYIGFSDWNLSQFPFYYSKKTKIQYFQSLSISNFSYPEFVISALVKLIENTFVEKRANFDTIIFSTISVISPILLVDNDVSNLIISILNKLKIVSYFPHPAIAGFLRYLTFTKTCNIINVYKSKTYPSWAAYLQLFPYFEKSFIDTCIFDCKQEDSLLPLYLSLCQYECTMLNGKAKRDKEKYMNFIKKKIVSEKLLSPYFVNKCELINYYPCFRKKTTSFLVKQTGFIPVAIIIGFGTFGAFTNKLQNPDMSFRSQIAIQKSRSVPEQVLRAQRRFDPLNSNFFNRHDRSSTRARSLGNKHPEILKNFLPAVFSPLHDIKAIDPDAPPVSITIKKLNKSFLIDFFEIDGKSYYSYFGISEKYQSLDKLSQDLDFEIQKLYPKSKNIISLIQATDTAESDHYLTTDLRSAFKLQRNQANAVIVPGIFNAMRTNNSFAVEPYTCYDFRIDPDKKNKKYTLRSLFQERNTQAFLNWTETLGHKYPLDFQIIDLIVQRMEIGFTVALNEDLKLIDNFLERFNITVDQPQSLIVFQNQLLRVAEEQILLDFYTQTNKYTIGKTRTITMNYALDKLIAKELEMEQISLKLKNLISNQAYSRYAERQRELHLENLTQRFQSVINEFANTPNFDAAVAEKSVTEFFQKLPFLTQSSVLLDQSNLGNFYPTGDNNGTRVDYTVLGAEQAAQDEGKNKNVYVRPAQEISDWRKNFETPLKGVYAAKTFIGRLIASEGFDDSSSASFIRQVKPDRSDPEIEAWMQKNARIRGIKLPSLETSQESAPDPFKANERKSQADLNNTNHKYY